MTGTLPPTTDPTRGVRRPWQALVLTRAAEFRFLLDEVVCGPESGRTPAERDAVEVHLRAAEAAAHEPRWRWTPRRRGSPRETAVERAYGELDAAEASLLRLASPDYFVGQLPSLLAQARSHLPRGDERLERLVVIANQHRESAKGVRSVDEADRTAAITAFRAASMESRRELARVHSVTVLLWSLSAALTIAALALAFVGWRNPAAVPLCFTPDDAAIVCPVRADTVDLSDGSAPDAPARDEGQVTAQIGRIASPGDLGLIELIGLIAAAVAGAASLRRLEGTSSPFNLPLAAAVLKLPTGMLTAVLGLVLMRGDFVPGLSALDNSAQILAWAALFGYSQELFTRFADTRTRDVLGKVGTPGDQKQPDGTTVPSITSG